MAKRGENIYKRKDGRWEGRLKAPAASVGQRRYRSVYGKTYREVKEKMNILRQIQVSDSFSRHDTMADAARLWMQAGKNNWKNSTCATYRQLLTIYILPYFGKVKIESINTETMENFISQIMERSKENRLSKNYLSQICLIVHRIIIYMNQKYNYRLPVPCNPISGKHSPHIVLPGENAMAILENYLYENCMNGTCLGILLAFHTGIRIGELSALKWSDINIEEKVLSVTHNILRIKETESAIENGQNMTHVVEQSPKTIDSVRIIPIPPRLLPLLQVYQKKDSSYVISGVKKPWAEPRTIQYRFKSILKKCHVEYFNFHMLRHAFASRCVAMKTKRLILPEKIYFRKRRYFTKTGFPKKIILLCTYRINYIGKGAYKR